MCMTIDEAINHCVEILDRLHDSEDCEDCKCYDEHFQLIQWLEELKYFRKCEDDNQSIWEEIKGNSTDIFDYYFRCKKCGGNTPPKAYVVAPDYCPHCGRYMMGGNSNETN